jgi:hypothetical protein
MVTQNTTVPFNFICLTDDPSGIEDGIQIIPIPSEPELEVWWNKLFMFKKGVLPKGKNVFFDLDLIIQKNIDDVLNYEPKQVSFVPRSWCNEGIPNNSSIIIWKDDQAEHIWDYFEADIDFTLWSYTGIDGFLSYENVPFDLLPEEWCYTYAYGNTRDRLPFVGQYMPEYRICLMNGIYKHLVSGHPNNPYKRKEYIQHMGKYV